MAAKLIHVIVGQPTTENMNKMVEQMAQMIAPIKTTAWGGHHGSLALILDNADYSSITKGNIASTKPVTQPDTINKGITMTSTPLKYSPSKKKPKSFKRSSTYKRQSPTSVSNASSTVLRNNTSKSTKSTLGTPTAPSKAYCTIFEPNGAGS